MSIKLGKGIHSDLAFYYKLNYYELEIFVTFFCFVFMKSLWCFYGLEVQLCRV